MSKQKHDRLPHDLFATMVGWQIRKKGDPLLGDDPERQPCDDREGFVHIMLDA